jgi:putative tryptophan/tyrosine transport system substrate-binding protein
MFDRKRRQFITLLGGAAAWPLAAHAQQPAVPVIGYIGSQSPETTAAYLAAFRSGLKEAGYVEGQNVAIEYRWGGGRFDALPALAADLVARGPSLIVSTGGDPVAVAVKAAAPTTPTVFLIGGDPVGQGLVASFNRPGGNATGVTMLTLELDAKRLGLLRELLPQSTTFAVLINPSFPGADARIRRIEEPARAIGLNVVILRAATELEIDKALSDLDPRDVSGLLIGGDPFFNSRRNQIIAHAARIRIPAMYEWREFVATGGLMSYGTNLPDVYRQVGVYSGRVIKGESPANLPVQQPTKFEFVINLKTAKVLGLEIPPTLLARADEVIE